MLCFFFPWPPRVPTLAEVETHCGLLLLARWEVGREKVDFKGLFAAL